MATANIRAITTGGAAGLLKYCLDPDAHKDDENYHPGERIQHVQNNFVANKDNPTGILDELSLQAGNQYECHHLRVSLKPGETLSNKQKDRFINHIMKEYLPNRNFIAIWHGDTEHLHCHILAQFLDTNLKPLSFQGQGKYKEAIRRQKIIDKWCQRFGLSVVDRNLNDFNQSRDKVRIAEVRMREREAYLWKDDLKARIKQAQENAVYTGDLLKELEKRGVHGQVNGRGISYSFKAEDGKEHIIKGKALGENFTLQHFKNIRHDYRQDAPTHILNPTEITQQGANGAFISPPSSPVSAGNTPAMVTGGGGSAGKDENLSKEEREAIAHAKKAEAEIRNSINLSLQTNAETEAKKQKGRRIQ